MPIKLSLIACLPCEMSHYERIWASRQPILGVERSGRARGLVALMGLEEVQSGASAKAA